MYKCPLNENLKKIKQPYYKWDFLFHLTAIPKKNNQENIFLGSRKSQVYIFSNPYQKLFMLQFNK